jgi:HSP20 family protein
MFGVIRKAPRDPWFEMLYNLERRMGRGFNEPFMGLDWPGVEVTTAAWTPVVDIFEEADCLRITAEVPGVKPENVKILVEGNLLTIQGTKEQVAEAKTEKVHRYERTYGSFERTFTLPTTVDAEHIKANYEAGVLTLTLPKIEKAKPRQIAVEITPEKFEKKLKA